MAKSILADIFEAECEVNHEDHARLSEDLAAFDAALDGLIRDAGVTAATEQLRRLQRRITDELLRHFATEEKTVLASLGRVRPELKPFCKAMKRQHAMLQRNWSKLQRLTEVLEYGSNQPGSAAQVRDYGHQFTRQMISHMTAEEKKIAGLTD